MGGENNPCVYLSVCVTGSPAATLAYLAVSVVPGILTVPIRPTRMVIVIGGSPPGFRSRVTCHQGPAAILYLSRIFGPSKTDREFLYLPIDFFSFALRADGTSIPPGTIECDEIWAGWLTTLG